MLKFYKIVLLIFVSSSTLFSQIKINEASNSNYTTVQINDVPLGDWFELYNDSGSDLNLQNYSITDDSLFPRKWVFNSILIPANGYHFFLANGEGKLSTLNHYETAVWTNEPWKYLQATSNPPSNWNTVGFNDAAWLSSNLSVGYGDGDDVTTLTGSVSSVFFRKTFNVSDKTKIGFGQLDFDYDDGFVAYLNGVEIARSGLTGNPPNWDESAADHEATIHQGGTTQPFQIDSTLLASLLVDGTNVLSIQVHNTNPASSDFTFFGFLTFGFIDNLTYYSNTTHPYFTTSGGILDEVNFTLKTKGETLYLYNPASILIDSLAIPDLQTDHSVGKFNDGQNTVRIFTTPTPNASNNGSTPYIGYVPEPTILTNSGNYSGSVSVTVQNNSPTNSTLHYLTTGQTPAITDNQYSVPLNFTATTALTVRAYPTDPNYLPSEKVSATYLIDDPTTLAIVSITTDDANLYGATGIFDNPTTDWKRACTIDYIGTDGQWKFSKRASIKPDGGAGGSRTNPQHSVTIEPANGYLGSGETIDYPLIPEKPYVEKFDAFYLRNGSNYWNQYPQKDATMMRMTKKSNGNYQAYTPVTVFLNGEYFGVYELREKANERYFEQNYGNDTDSLDLCSVSYFYGANTIRPVKGSDTSYYNMVDYISNLDPTDPDYWNKCDKKLDLKNYVDYLACETWFGNYDWLYNNMKFARTRTFDNKWRFFFQDMELGIGGGWSNAGSDLIDHLETQNLPNTYNQMYVALMQNSKYRNYFINRYADLMNTIFTQDEYTPIVNGMYNELFPEMPRHFQRWTGDPSGGMTTFFDMKLALLNDFDARNTNVRQHIVNNYSLVKEVTVTLDVFPAGAGYIKISTIVPETLPWTGIYFDGNPVQITAVANPGYTFSNWEANGIINSGDLTKEGINLNIDNSSLFRALFIGSPETTKPIVSEIHYHPDSTLNGGNWIELYNPSSVEMNLTSYKLKTYNHWENFEIPAGTKIPANGYLVIVQDSNLFKSVYPTVTNFIGNTFFGWSNNRDSVILKNPFGETIIAFEYRDSWVHTRIADGFGRTVENRSNSTIYSDFDWLSGCIGGSPGARFTQCVEELQITEINYNNTFSGDWFEIKNNTNAPINLTNLRYLVGKDTTAFSFGTATIPGNSYLTVYQNQLFETYHSGLSSSEQNSQLILGNDAAIRIYDATGKLISSIRYENNIPWATTPTTEHRSIELIENVASNGPNHPENWSPSCEGGSPSEKRSFCPEVPIGELFGIYPNPNNGNFNLSITNLDPNAINELRVFDMSGRIVYFAEISSPYELYSMDIDLSYLRSGMYYIQMKQGSKTDQHPVIITK